MGKSVEVAVAESDPWTTDYKIATVQVGVVVVVVVAVAAALTDATPTAATKVSYTNEDTVVGMFAMVSTILL
nr:hypothetical protein HmN_000962700 [Hymenolepis microstoma]